MPHPLQNRVHPSGDIVATDARGTMLGNRGGKFHRDDQTLSKRRWASEHWICCELHYKNWHHEPMGRGYTSLFFLDEVTALAAGHRPCFMCRHAEARRFVALSGKTTAALDRQLHAERKAERPETAIAALPDGTMIAQDGETFALRGPHLLRWTWQGYAGAVSRSSVLRAKLLTPSAITAILAKGYQPRWHESAQTWGK